MSQRLRYLPANQLTTRLSDAQRQLQEQKAAQIAGSHNVQLVRTVTGNSPDITVTATYGVLQQWTATFTPASGAFPNLGFVWEFFWVESINPSHTWTAFMADTSDNHTYKMTVMGNTSGTTDVYTVNVVVYAVGAGTISIVKTI